MDGGITLQTGGPISGRAFPVQCAPGDNLMVHAAIYKADPGDVIVASGAGSRLALAGGNVCAVAQQRGIAGFVLDGTFRDIAEVRELGFSVFSRGTCPKPGTKREVVLANAVTVGGVLVRPGDIIVADEDGIVVATPDEVAQIQKEIEPTLEQWMVEHRAKISRAIGEEL